MDWTKFIRLMKVTVLLLGIGNLCIAPLNWGSGLYYAAMFNVVCAMLCGLCMFLKYQE